MSSSSRKTPLQHTEEENDPIVVPPPPPLITTRMRRGLTPYLPPPVVVAIRDTIDPTLEQYVGPEASMTLLLTLLVSFVLWKLLSWMTQQHTTTSSTTLGALQDDEEEDGIPDLFSSDTTTTTTKYEETIVLCGPCQAGKTSLFYTLLYPADPENWSTAAISTVSTLKPNAGIWYSTTTTNDDADLTHSFRLLDTPGHWSPTKLLQTLGAAAASAQSSYIWVVVLDATQPVTATVDYLYAILLLLLPVDKPKKLLVVCTKSDSYKAKNIRRLKLQIRKELERLEESSSSSLKNTNNHGDGPAAAAEHNNHNTKNWEEVLTTHVEFVSTSMVVVEGKESPSSSSSFQNELVSFLQRR